MAQDDMKARHEALIADCVAPNPGFPGPIHTKKHDVIERERQTKLLAAILEKLHAA